MMRCAFGLLVVILVSDAGLTGQTQTAVIRETADTLAEKLATGDDDTIAVADFTDLQGRTTELGRLLAEELSVELVNAGQGLRIIDRSHLRTLLAEHKLGTGGLIDPETVAEMGRIAGVGILITGTVTEAEGVIRLSVKALKTDTAMIMAAQNVTLGQSGGMVELIRRDVIRPASTTDRGTTGLPSRSVRSYQNDVLMVTVEMAAVQEQQLSLSLTFENKTSEAIAVLCRAGQVVDNMANIWRPSQLYGVTYYAHSRWDMLGANRRILEEASQLAPSARASVTLRTAIRRASGSYNGKPSLLSFSADCARVVNGVAMPFSVGIPNISVQ